MNPNYSFDPVKLARETRDVLSSKLFTSWVEVVRVLARRGFNRFEAEAILRSNTVVWCRDEFGPKGPDEYGPEPGTKSNSGTMSKFLDSRNITPGCKVINKMVMNIFGKDYDLELNDRGQPCRRGTMPGNYDRNRTVLVPLGTPACCDPTTETYWSM